jgi:hypothetical protein
MYPQQFQGQAYAPQGVWGNQQFAPFTPNLNEVVSVISRLLPLLQSQGNPFTPQTNMFGFPQQFGSQGPMTNPIGHPGMQFPFQSAPWTTQGSPFGYSQFSQQTPNLVEIVNLLSRALPVLQQSGLLGQQASPFGFPQQQFGPHQGIQP